MADKKKFDLDALVAETTDAPFTFTLGGEEFAMSSPQSLDWRDAVAIDAASVDVAMALLLGDDFEAFSKHAVPVAALTALMTAYREHFGLEAGE
jgi:hypothetical protein